MASPIRKIPSNENYAQFLARVKLRVIEEGECWMFQQDSSRRRKGPSIKIFDDDQPRMVDIRRHIMHLAGKIPDGEGYLGKRFVMSTCGERQCVNPAHIKMGNRAEITKQSIKLLRWHHSPTRRARLQMAAAGRRKLGPDQVAAIRVDTRSQRAIAADYGVSIAVVRRVRDGSAYASVGVGMFTGLMR